MSSMQKYVHDGGQLILHLHPSYTPLFLKKFLDTSKYQAPKINLKKMERKK